MSESLFIKMTVNCSLSRTCFSWRHFEISSDLLFSSSSGLELIIISFSVVQRSHLYKLYKLRQTVHRHYRSRHRHYHAFKEITNHPPNIIKQLPASINRRISDISSNEHEFNKAKPIYDDALKSSGYTEMLSFSKHRHPVRLRRNRQRNIIWYNPPFEKNADIVIRR